jgi:hypothetical protein
MTSTARPGGTEWKLPTARAVTVFVGNFGSGKTEIALNYAFALADAGERVRLVDVDLVNPYFRSREVRDYARRRGVEVIAPAEEYELADLPILLRQVGGAIAQGNGRVILDVGGDDLGARVLGGFTDELRGAHTAVLQVVNERRPFTDSLTGARKMYEELEAASRLRISGLVANAHLIHETTAEVIRRGVEFTRRFAAEVKVPLEFVAIERRMLETLDAASLGSPVLIIDRLMTSPWEKSNKRGPIGRSPPVSMPTGVK